MSEQKFRAGDLVYHKFWNETWVLAVDEFNGRVAPCGWPETIAKAEDCELRERANDLKRHRQLLDSSKIRNLQDIRRKMADVQLSKRAREE